MLGFVDALNRETIRGRLARKSKTLANNDRTYVWRAANMEKSSLSVYNPLGFAEVLISMPH